MIFNSSPDVGRFSNFGWFLALLLSVPMLAAAADAGYDSRIARILQDTPLLDGHNDLAWEIRERYNSQLSAINLGADTSKLPVPKGAVPLMTDVPRLRAGRVG